jgi:hypothetical protein
MSVDERGGAQQSVEQKLDVLSAFVDKRFNAVDENFKAVTAALVEQREYTEFAFGRLEARLDGVEARLAGVEPRLDRMEARLDRLDQRMEAGFGKVDGRFARLERKLDQIIDLQIPRIPPAGSDAE